VLFGSERPPGLFVRRGVVRFDLRPTRPRCCCAGSADTPRCRCGTWTAGKCGPCSALKGRGWCLSVAPVRLALPPAETERLRAWLPSRVDGTPLPGGQLRAVVNCAVRKCTCGRVVPPLSHAARQGGSPPRCILGRFLPKLGGAFGHRLFFAPFADRAPALSAQRVPGRPPERRLLRRPRLPRPPGRSQQFGPPTPRPGSGAGRSAAGAARTPSPVDRAPSTARQTATPPGAITTAAQTAAPHAIGHRCTEGAPDRGTRGLSFQLRSCASLPPWSAPRPRHATPSPTEPPGGSGPNAGARPCTARAGDQPTSGARSTGAGHRGAPPLPRVRAAA